MKKLDADGNGSLNAEEIEAFEPPQLERRGAVAAPNANELIPHAERDGDQQPRRGRSFAGPIAYSSEGHMR